MSIGLGLLDKLGDPIEMRLVDELGGGFGVENGL